jgi:glucosamine-6-phosphate deaminase
MRLRVFPSAEVAARALARDIVRAIRSDPGLVLGLPTGRTPLPLYGELARAHRAGDADFSRVTTFNLDEFAGITPADPRSYRSYMQRHLFDHINASRRRTHFLNGAAADLDAECRRYERAIRRAGGIDILVLGLGTNGHVGFNEPAAALVARTHRARLMAPTRRANAALFDGRLADVPREGLSMGIGTILSARRIVLVATGRAKAACVQRTVEGPVTPRLPASFLQLHANVEVWVDRAGAGRRQADLKVRPTFS